MTALALSDEDRAVAFVSLVREAARTVIHGKASSAMGQAAMNGGVAVVGLCREILDAVLLGDWEWDGAAPGDPAHPLLTAALAAPPFATWLEMSDGAVRFKARPTQSQIAAAKKAIEEEGVFSRKADVHRRPL